MASLDININQVNADFTDIKTAITNSGVEIEDGTPTSEYADKVLEVYEVGQNKLLSDIWDSFQNYGKRVDYDHAFCGWRTDYFYPKYDFVPTNANWFTRDMRGDVIDLVDRLNECGVKMDFSKCTNITYLFYFAPFNHVPELDLRSVNGSGGFTYLFGGNVVTVDKIIIKDDGSQNLSNVFGYASALENIVIEGVNGAVSSGRGLDVHWSTKLSKASIINLINVLGGSDVLTVTKPTATFSIKAVNKAFETESGLNDGSTSLEWTTLVNTKPNWTISLV